MNGKRNRAWALLLSALLVCLMGVPAYAHSVPELDHLCSLTVTMCYAAAPVSGGSLSLYRVAEVAEEDGNYSFRPAGDFAHCGESFENLENAPDMAARLEMYAQSLAPMDTKEIGDDGAARFEELPVGLYLLIQRKAAPGYAKLTPFLVSLPYLENGEYLYDLSANPKTDLERVPETTQPPTTEPTEPAEPDLPQTGQLWWPVPLLVCGGLALVAVGFALNRRKQTDER